MISPSLQVSPFRNGSFDIHAALNRLKGHADWVGLRLVQENTQHRGFRNGKIENSSVLLDRGVMVEVWQNGHAGYSATSNLSESGIKAAFETAKILAINGGKKKLVNFTSVPRPRSVGTYRSPAFQDLSSKTLIELSETLRIASEKLKVSDKIVTALAEARLIETTIHFVSSDGSDTFQEFLMLSNNYAATAQQGSESQTRTDHGGVARCVQMGLEFFDEKEIYDRCEIVGKQAVELLSAPNCPSDIRDLLLAPDQMLLQIHESIGHPLEIDRILGDERNFAGWSFVEPSDFGTLKYGSPLMNITFDPSVPGEYASYGFDDGGTKAERQYLIEKGLLVRGLGGAESQLRSKIPGVANLRASSWNRAPIDRMANINMEPGTSSLQEMISQTEKGIYMEANVSWSIDDYRRKFQFGCEYARLIENGKLTSVVKNPNYRGVTVPFWKSLKAVGRADEVEIYGSPYCGKGEPSQVIRVGHASPPCLFNNIEVFGGGQ